MTVGPGGIDRSAGVAGWPERLSRLVVMLSMLLGVGVGMWPLADQPGLAMAVGAVFAGGVLAARWNFAGTAAAVLVFAYVSYGLVRLVLDPAAAAIPFWLAIFAGVMVGGSPWTRWMAARGWQIPLAWWATGVALSWPVVAAAELGFTWTASLDTGPIVAAAMVQMSAALWLDRLAAPQPADRGLADLGTIHAALALSAIATALAAVFQRTVEFSWMSGEPWISLRRATGLMGDANPMGVVSALWAPLALSLAWSNARRHDDASNLAGAARGPEAGHVWWMIAGCAAAMLLWTAAWLSGARSTLILYGFGVAGVFLMVTGHRGASSRRVLVAGLAAALLLAVGAALGAGRGSGSPLGRLVASLPAGAASAVAYEVFWRRDGYGLAAVEAIKEHPLHGVGIGRFASLAPGYSGRVEPLVIPPDNAQSLWRQTLAERGLLGLAPIVWLTVLTAQVLVRRPRRLGADGPLAPAPDGGAHPIVLKAMVAGLGVAMLFGYPLQDPAVGVTLATLVGSVVARVERSGDVAEARWAGWVWLALLAMAVLGAVLDYAW